MNKYLHAGGDILIPTDFTPHAQRAFEMAIRMAKLLGSKLKILHVNEEEAFFAWHDSARVSHLLSEIAPKRMKWMQQLQEDAQAQGVDAESMSREGVASGTILAVAEELDVAMIVMGTRGARGMRHLLTGSTARNVLRGSSRPVLAVSAPEEATQGQEETGSFNHVLYPTDFSETSTRGLEFLRGLVDHADQRVTILHVLRLPTMLPSLPGEPLVVFPTGENAEFEPVLQQQLRAVAASVNAATVDTHLELHANVAESILEVAEKIQVDLIVIPRHSQHTWRSFFFGHTTESLTKISTVPVIVFDPMTGDEH